MTTERRRKQSSRMMRLLDVALCWRHMKLLTMFGAILGIVAFIEVNQAMIVLIPGLALVMFLILGIIRDISTRNE